MKGKWREIIARIAAVLVILFLVFAGFSVLFY